MNKVEEVASNLKTYSVNQNYKTLHPITLQEDIREMISNLEKVLSDPIIKYDITFAKTSYSFKEPLDDEERAFYAKQRQKLIKSMLKKAICKFIDNHYKWKGILENSKIDEEYNDTSFNLIQHIIYMHPTDMYISEPVGESYEIKIDDLNRKLIGDAKPCKCYRFEGADIKIDCDGKCAEIS